MLPLTYFQAKWILIVLLQGYLLFGAYSLASSADIIKELPRLVLDTHLGNDEFNHEYQAAAISPQDNSLWVAIRFYKLGDEENWKYSLWKLNQKGEKIHEVPLSNLTYRPVGLHSLMVLRDGSFLYIADPIYSPSLIKINQDGKVLFVENLVSAGGKLSVSKVMQTSDGHFLLLGNKGDNALAIKVAGTGKVLWEKVFDRKRHEFLVDGLPLEDGGAIAIGSSAVLGKASISSSEIFIMKLDKDGNTSIIKSFPERFNPLSPGYPGCFTQAREGSYWIVYDRADSMDRDIWVKALDRTLKDLWETPLTKLKHDAGMFRVVPVSSGGFLVVGSKNFFLSVSNMDQNGKIIWEYLADPSARRRLAIFDVIADNEKIMILRSVHSSNFKKQRNDKIGVLAFLPKWFQ